MLFVIGLLVGVLATVTAMSICIVAGDSDQASEHIQEDMSASYGGGGYGP